MVDELIPLSTLKPYLREHFGKTVTRQTPYNWASRGRLVDGVCVKLVTINDGGILYTTYAAVDRFFRENRW